MSYDWNQQLEMRSIVADPYLPMAECIKHRDDVQRNVVAGAGSWKCLAVVVQSWTAGMVVT